MNYLTVEIDDFFRKFLCYYFVFLPHYLLIFLTESFSTAFSYQYQSTHCIFERIIKNLIFTHFH